MSIDRGDPEVEIDHDLPQGNVADSGTKNLQLGERDGMQHIATFLRILPPF